MVPLSSDPGVGNVEALKKRKHQDWVTHDVTVFHVPVVRQASVFLAERVVGHLLR